MRKILARPLQHDFVGVGNARARGKSRSRIEHVDAEKLGLHVHRAQFRNECLTRILTPAGDHDLRAFSGKRHRGGSPNSA